MEENAKKISQRTGGSLVDIAKSKGSQQTQGNGGLTAEQQNLKDWTKNKLQEKGILPGINQGTQTATTTTTLPGITNAKTGIGSTASFNDNNQKLQYIAGNELQGMTVNGVNNTTKPKNIQLPGITLKSESVINKEIDDKYKRIRAENIQLNLIEAQERNKKYGSQVNSEIGTQFEQGARHWWNNVKKAGKGAQSLLLERMAQIGYANGAFGSMGSENAKLRRDEWIEDSRKSNMEYKNKINNAFEKRKKENVNQDLVKEYSGKTFSELARNGDTAGLKYKTIGLFADNISLLPNIIVTAINTPAGLTLMGSDTFIQESQNGFDEMIENGATYEEARNGAFWIGAINAGIEMGGEYLFGIVGPASRGLRNLFTKNVVKEVEKNVYKKTLPEIVYRGGRAQIKSALGEGGEEGLQEIVNNIFVGMVNDDRGLFDNLRESIEAGGVMGLLIPGGALESVTTDIQTNKKIDLATDIEALNYVIQGEQRKTQRMQQKEAEQREKIKQKILSRRKANTWGEVEEMDNKFQKTEGENSGFSDANDYSTDTTISENSSHGDRMTTDSFFETDENGDYIEYNGSKLYAGETIKDTEGQGKIGKNNKSMFSGEESFVRNPEYEEYRQNFYDFLKDLSKKIDNKTKKEVVLGKTQSGSEVKLTRQQLKHIIKNHGAFSLNDLLETINNPTYSRMKIGGNIEGDGPFFIKQDPNSGRFYYLSFKKNKNGSYNINTFYEITKSNAETLLNKKLENSNDEKYQLKYEEKGYTPGVANKKEKNISGKEGIKQKNTINDQTVEELAEKYGVKVEVIKGMIEILKKGKGGIIIKDGEAYGKYRDQLLTLSEQIKESTAPHELLHAIFDMIDPETKVYLISQVMKSEGWNAETAEERLADSFSNFFRTGKIEGAPKSTWGRIKIFFKRVRSFINGMNKWRNELDEIFTDIITADGIVDLQSKIDESSRLNKSKEKMRKRFMEYRKNAQKIQSNKAPKDWSKKDASYQIADESVYELQPLERIEQMEKNILDEYGETDNPGRVAFIDNKGRWINGNMGGYGNYRDVDHREIAQTAFDDTDIEFNNGTDGLVALQAQTGLVRVNYNDGYMNIDTVYELMPSQREGLMKFADENIEEVNVDITDQKTGRTVKSETFMNVRDAIRFIDRHFSENGNKFQKAGDINSEAFKKRFGDSKIVNEDGSPKIMYHGTPTRFTIFDKSKIGDNTGNYGYSGDGFYFTDSKDYAGSYGNNVMEVYLKVEKPFTFTKENIKKYAKYLAGVEQGHVSLDKDWVLKELKRNDEKSYDFAMKRLDNPDNAWKTTPYPYDMKYDPNNIVDLLRETERDGRGYEFESVNLDYFEGFGKPKYKDDVYYYPSDPAYMMGLGEYSNQEFVDAIRKDGFDGIITFGEVVVFDSNQVKSATDNVGTYDENNDDIRYQKMDDEYAEAVENGNTTRAKAILREYAKEKGYNSSTDYQGSLAFNGSAPASDGLTKEERVSGNEDIYSQTLGDFASDGLDGWDLERQLDPNGGLGVARARASRKLSGAEYDLESINNLRNAVMEYKKGNKDVKIRMYRAIDSDIKEEKFRNGDWITPSKEYAKHHIDLQDWKKGRVISEDVSIEDIRWDGNDINERGFDNEKEYGYKDTPNNRKELEITYDDNGNLIPLSERFNENVEDERYQKAEDKLINLHNLSMENLRKSKRLGGFPMPSIAITKEGVPHTSYGDISVIFKKDTVDPSKNKANKLFGVDAYTPTVPRIVAIPKNTKEADKIIDKIQDETGLSYGEVLQWIEYKEDYERYYPELLKYSDLHDKVADYKIFDGYTPAGKRRYLDYNLENLVKKMKKTDTLGAFGNFGNLVGAEKGKVKSIEDIRAMNFAPTNLEEYRELSKEYSDNLREFYNNVIRGDSPLGYDMFSRLVESTYNKDDNKRLNKLNEEVFEQFLKRKITLDDVKKIHDPIKRGAEMVRPYAEAKPERAVGFDEVGAIVVPNEQLEEARELMKDTGVDVYGYAEGERMNVIDAVADDNGLKYQKAGDTNSEAFKKRFGNSKVVDKYGNPLVVYHGTANKFTAFSKEMIGSNFNQDIQGFFFTDSKESAEDYANNTSYGLPRNQKGNVMEVYLSIQNPLIKNIDYDPIELRDNNYERFIKEANNKGADGIIIKADEGQSMYIPFNPNQIKSATDNVGTYDENNDDIRFQKAGNTKSANFKKRFDGSKVVKENGKPQIVYHGTTAEFTVFNKIASRGIFGDGYYFTNRIGTARQYGYGRDGRVMKVYLAIKNPYVADNGDGYFLDTKKLKEEGYDGVQAIMGSETYWVAFDSNQIKSATDNVGTYDPNNDDIRYQRVYHGSIADFDRFDNTHMGEGEGTQARGYGFYVAFDKDVAKGYAEWIYHNKKNPEEYRLVKDKMDGGMSFDEARNEVMEEIQSDIEEISDSGYKDLLKRQIESLKNMKEDDLNNINRKRNLYEIEIPDEIKAKTPTGKNYLDYDKKITLAQYEKMKKALNEYGDFTDNYQYNLDYRQRDYAWGGKGGALYDWISVILGGDKEASEFLNSIGYDGIKYDGGGDGNSAVIINDEALDIVNHEKYQKTEYEYDENGNRKWIKFGDNSEFDPSIFGTPTKEEQIEEDKENEKSNPFYNAWMKYNNQNYKDDQLTLGEFVDAVGAWGDKKQEEFNEKQNDILEAENDPKMLELQLRAVKLMEEEGNVGKKFGKNVSKEVRDRQQAEVEKKREDLAKDIYEWMYPGLSFEESTYEDQSSAWDKEAEWEMLGREKIEEKLRYFKKDSNGNWEKKNIKLETPQEQREKIEKSGNFDEVIEPKDRVIQWETPEGQKGRLDKAKDPRQFKKVMEKINSGKSKTKVELKDVTNEVRSLERYKENERAEKERRKKEKQEEYAKKKQEEYKRNVRLKAFQRLVDMQRFEKFTFLTEDEIKQRWGFTDEEWKKITEQLDLGYPPKKRNEKAVSDFNKAVDSEVKFIIEGLTRQNNMKRKDAEKNLGEIGEIDLDVLLGKDEEKGQKEVEEFERIAEEEKKKSKKEKNKRLEQAREDVTQVEIDKERENSKSEKERVDKIIKSTKTDNTVWGSIKKTASDILTPVSTRIREISPKIYRELMRYFQNKDILTNQRLKEIDPFLKAMGKIRKENPVRFMDIWVALANRNIGYANGLLQEYGVKVPTKLLDTIFDEAEDVGLNINYLGSYYPLSVKAPKSFLEELMKVGNGDIASEIEKKIQQESQKKGGPLDESEITAIINSVIAGEEKGPDVNLGNKHLKKRNTEIERTPQMLEYCDDPISTLITYIEGMTDKIERAKFLGKSRSGNVHTLADYVYNAKNGLTAEQQDELMELLKSVFNDASPNKFYQTWRDIATLTTLGSPSSTLTQIGDLSFSIYENGWREALKAVWDIFMKRKAFDLKDMGVVNRGEEYTNINSQNNLLQKAIHNVFKLTFFSNFDTFGKSTFIQSTWNKRRKRALKGENGDPQLIKDIMKITDDEYTTMKIINDLRNGVFSEDVALVMYMKLGNIQPLTKAQMPKAYLDNPNGRLFYQFKTFGIKQLDYVLQETKQQTKGFKNLSTTDKFLRVAQIASMIFIMTLMGAGASELKDITMRRRSNSILLRWLFGEEVGSDQIWDKIGDSALQLFGLSRYTVMQMKSDPVDAITSLFTTFPATNLVTYPFKDIVKAFKNDGSINWRNPSSYQLIPVIGKYRYWIYGGGQDKQQEALDKEKKTTTSGGSSRSTRTTRNTRNSRSRRNTR